MLLELFKYTVNNYEDSLLLFESIKAVRHSKRKLIPGLVL